MKYSYPFSLDVVALYTSVPTNEVILSTVKRLTNIQFNYHGIQPVHVEMILKTILNRRIFRYKENLYEQTSGLAMGNKISGTLATIVMDDLERQTLTADLSIGFYSRYVDDTFILTENASTAQEIFTKLNTSHSTLKFEMENPIDNALSILDFTVRVNNGMLNYTFFRKAARKNTFVHQRTALPDSQKANIIKNEINRIQTRCTTTTQKKECILKFKNELLERGYSETFISNLSQQPERRPQTENKHYFYFPFINDKFDKRVKIPSENLDSKSEFTGKNRI